jgi:multicomponent Na+:H+ antiporter subunit G
MTDAPMDFVTLWTLVRHPAGAIFCVLGALLCLIGSIGVLRFPDFYTRIHAASLIDTGGAMLVIFGMALMAPDLPVFAKLGAIIVFLFLTGPTATHALASAAQSSGLQPLIGRVKKRARIGPRDDQGAV